MHPASPCCLQGFTFIFPFHNNYKVFCRQTIKLFQFQLPLCRDNLAPFICGALNKVMTWWCLCDRATTFRSTSLFSIWVRRGFSHGVLMQLLSAAITVMRWSSLWADRSRQGRHSMDDDVQQAAPLKVVVEDNDINGSAASLRGKHQIIKGKPSYICNSVSSLYFAAGSIVSKRMGKRFS